MILQRSTLDRIYNGLVPHRSIRSDVLRLGTRAGGRAAGFPVSPLRLKHISNSDAALKICIISGCGGDSRRYRCDHTVEALQHAGFVATVVPLERVNLRLQRDRLARTFDVAILHRAGWSARLAGLVDRFRAHGTTLLFDTDDLTFSPEEEIHTDEGLRKLVRKGDAQRQAQTLLQCDGAICSTQYLAQRLQAKTRHATVIRNGFSAEMLDHADVARTAVSDSRADRADQERVIIGYGSGTPTHDRDFAVIEDVIGDILAEHPHVELHLVGWVAPPPALARFGDRIVQQKFTPWRHLPHLLARFDINLAPFVGDSTFNRGKSELKYIEAAMVAVPTVASPLPAYKVAIEHGRNGFIPASKEQWRESLTALVQDRELREQMGREARTHALEHYALESRAAGWAALFDHMGVSRAPRR